MSGLENPSPTDHSPQKGHRLLGWIGAASTLVAVAAWQVLTFKPDFVLLQLYENDFETPNMTVHRPPGCDGDSQQVPLNLAALTPNVRTAGGG